MKNINVKIISSRTYENLEQDINSYLNETDDNIVDLKYMESSTEVHAFITYNKTKNNY